MWRPPPHERTPLGTAQREENRAERSSRPGSEGEKFFLRVRLRTWFGAMVSNGSDMSSDQLEEPPGSSAGFGLDRATLGRERVVMRHMAGDV